MTALKFNNILLFQEKQCILITVAHKTELKEQDTVLANDVF